MKSITQTKRIIEIVKKFQADIRDTVRQQLLTKSATELSKVVAEGSGDVSYQIDAAAEQKIEAFAMELSHITPVTVTAEGVGRKSFGSGPAKLEVLIDPIDGTRGIMYNFRSAWVLTGIAVANPKGAHLSDIHIAVQTEIPITKQDKASVLWAIKGEGAYEEIWDLRDYSSVSRKRLQPSQARQVDHGFASFVDFFPGSKEEIGRLAETVFERVIGPVKPGKANVFDDQYICNAGQMYLLASGTYRFIADLRPEMERLLQQKGRQLGLASHPYDICTALIAQEGGAIITDAEGHDLAYPFDTNTNCNWIGYANSYIRQQVEPILLDELAKLRQKAH